MFSMKILLSRMLRKYRITTELKFNNIKIRYGIIAKLVGNHYVKLHHRDYV